MIFIVSLHMEIIKVDAMLIKFAVKNYRGFKDYIE